MIRQRSSLAMKNHLRLIGLLLVAACTLWLFPSATVHAQDTTGGCDQLTKDGNTLATLTPTDRAAIIARCTPSAIEQPPGASAHILHPYQWYQQERARLRVLGSTDNLEYKGGPIMQTVASYTIYWIPSGASIPATYQTFINQYFSDIGATAFSNILTQYYQNPGTVHIQNVSTFGGSYMYTANFPHAGSASAPLTDADIQGAVQAAITANSWPRGLNTMYFVFTPQGIESCMSGGKSCTIGVTASPVDSSQAYCAYHNSFDMSGQKVIYANMPYVATWDSGYAFDCHGAGFASTPNDHDADEEISVTSHEHFEAVSDPLVNVNTAWTEDHNDKTKFGEIGDKCAYIFSSPDPTDGHNVVLNGHPYEVQQEWSNAAFNGTAYSGCVLQHNANVDVAVNKTGPASVIAGTTMSYNLTVTNNDTVFEAADNALSDDVPANTTFVSFSQTGGPSFSCAVPALGSTGTIRCTRLSLPAGNSAAFTLVVNVNPSAPDGSTLSNTASVTTTSNDPNASNNASTLTTAVTAAADLIVDKRATSDLVIAGTTETYTLTVANNGPSDAQNVTLSDITPANTTFISLTQDLGTAFTCATPAIGGAGAINCTIPTLPVGGSATFTLATRVSAVDTSTISNTASIAATTLDPDQGNNASKVTTVVSIQQYKQRVLADLATLRSGITNEDDRHNLHEAMEALAESLEAKRWADGNTLVVKQGNKVFTEEKEAVAILGALIKHNKSGISGALQAIVDRLVAVDRGLADIAINQAIGDGGRPNRIARAQKQLAQGDTSASKGNATAAISHYNHAWQYAQQAMRKEDD